MAYPPFPGFPVFLELAADQIGCPESAGPAGRIAILSALAHLCAQASLADDAHVPGILAKAAEFRDQLRAAALAADLMLAEVAQARELPDPGPETRELPDPSPETRELPDPSPETCPDDDPTHDPLCD
jgi:hypothetical protein